MSGASGAKVLFARPFRLNDEPMMPCVLKLDKANKILVELEEGQKAMRVFGLYMHGILKATLCR